MVAENYVNKNADHLLEVVQLAFFDIPLNSPIHLILICKSQVGQLLSI